MEIERKLQILKDLREQSNDNQNRISRTENKETKKKETKKKSKAVSSFSIRLMVAVLLFLGILLAEQSSDVRIRKATKELYREISVNQMENLFGKGQYHD